MSQYTSGKGGESGSFGDQAKKHGSRGGRDSGHRESNAGNGSKNDPKKIANQVKHGAGETMSQVKDQAQSAINQQKESAAQKLHSVGQAIRDSAQGLHEQNVPGVQYIDQAADSLEQFSNFIRESDFHDVVDTVENWARRHPAVFLGGSLLAGLLLARFVKSSRDNSADRFGQNRFAQESRREFGGSASSRYDRGHQSRPTASMGGLRGGIESTSSSPTGSSQYASGSASPSTTAPGMTVPGNASGSGSPAIGSGGPSSSWEES